MNTQIFITRCSAEAAVPSLNRDVGHDFHPTRWDDRSVTYGVLVEKPLTELKAFFVQEFFKPYFFYIKSFNKQCTRRSAEAEVLNIQDFFT